MTFDQNPDRNCANGNLDAWFPTRTNIALVRQATSLCDGCPVITECLDFALASELGVGKSGRAGIYGGTTPAERFKMDARLREGLPKYLPIRHGTEGGERAHRRRGETPCGLCAVAKRRAAADRERKQRAAS